jgi:integral membrane protein
MEAKVRNLRIVGIAEGISFLVLLLIAMPLKYYMNMPLAVKYVGWAHGVLFIAYVIAVFLAIKAMRWNWFSVLVALGASLLPFGTFVLDKELKKRQAALASETVAV